MSALATVVNLSAPTQAQVICLNKFGITSIPSTKGEASALITAAIASRDMTPATSKQVGRIAILGGRDMPGAGMREASNAIAVLEHLAALDNVPAEQTHEVLASLVAILRQRYLKPVKVVIHAPVETEEAPF